MSQTNIKSNYPLFLPSVTKTFADFANIHTDQNKRLHETKNALNYTLEYGYFDKIVIVDGSNNEVLSKEEINEFLNVGIIVEQLFFQQDIELVRNYGKGHGEMQITNYMIQNSKLVNEAGGFVKITPRYFFKNINSILPFISNKSNVFFFYYPPIVRRIKPFVCTIFYKTSIKFYKENFENTLNQHNKQLSGYAESVFYRNIINLNKSKLCVDYPFFYGLAGTTGKQILNQYYQIRNFLSKNGLMCYEFK